MSSAKGTPSRKKLPHQAKVKRIGHKSSGGGGIRSFAVPIGLVLLGIAAVFVVGYWVNGHSPAAKSAEQGKSAAPPTQTQAPASTVPPAAAPVVAAPATPPPTPAPAVDPNKAILEQRAHIDRAGTATETMLVKVFYVDGLRNDQALQPVEIRVPKNVARLKVTADQVVQAPGDALKLYSGFPAGVSVKSVALSSGLAKVDLSPEVATIQGSASVNDLTAALVYSLTDVAGVNSVQVLVNGRPAMLHGLDLSKPLTRADVDRNGYVIQPVIRFVGKP